MIKNKFKKCTVQAEYFAAVYKCCLQQTLSRIRTTSAPRVPLLQSRVTIGSHHLMPRASVCAGPTSVVWCGDTVWCGVVWCGVVWSGVVRWYGGTVWCGVVWCGVVWCGTVWCGVVWCGVVWCGVVRWYGGTVWCGARPRGRAEGGVREG